MLLLNLFESAFAIECDENWRELLADLWAPFVVHEVSTEAIDVQIVRRDGTWRLALPDYTANAEDPWVLALTFRNAISSRALKASSGVVGLHASIATRDDVVLCIAGDSRAGKTTLLLDLVTQGWTYGSDDVAPLSLETSQVTAAPKPIHVRDSARWRSLLQLWTPPRWLPAPGKEWLVPSRVFGRREVLTVTPTHVIFPRYKNEASPHKRELTTAEATALCAAHIHPSAPGALKAIARMCVRAQPAAVIEYGSTDDSLQLLAKILAGSGRKV